MYGCGLGQSAALLLARQHNEYNQVQRSTSFGEIAANCRRLLFAQFAPEISDTVHGDMPDLPRYNSQQYREFKAECMTLLVSTQIVRRFVCWHMYL